jgi:hypothetical protein
MTTRNSFDKPKNVSSAGKILPRETIEDVDFTFRDDFLGNSPRNAKSNPNTRAWHCV